VKTERRTFLKQAAAAGSLLGLPRILRAEDARAPDGKPQSPTNILLIMADDMGFECVRANGGTSYHTPNLDRLAKEGAHFNHCYSQPICTPSRVQIMSGIYNDRNYDKFRWMGKDVTTFAQLLRRAGYATAIAGKWQLSGNRREPRPEVYDDPGHFGFDQYCLWHLFGKNDRYKKPNLFQDGKPLDARGRYGPDICTEYLMEFMTRHKDGPFLAYYPMLLTHDPFHNPPARPDGDRAEELGETPFQRMVSRCDYEVHRLTEHLKKLGIADRTLVMFTGDNGCKGSVQSQLNGRTVHGGKGRSTDAGTHVPLIAWQPGRIAAGRNDHLVDFSDFLPTICEAAGVPVPEILDIDGLSFLPTLYGTQTSVKTGHSRDLSRKLNAPGGRPLWGS